MGPKSNTQTGHSRGGSRRGGGVSVVPEGITGVLVEDLLLVDDYDRYLNSFHSARLTSSRFFCNIDDIDMLGFGFKH